MDMTDKLISIIKSGMAAIAASADKGVITFQRAHSIVTIHKAHIVSVNVTDKCITINTSNGRESFYECVDRADRDGNTAYLAAVAVLRDHGYIIPSFADLTPTAK